MRRHISNIIRAFIAARKGNVAVTFALFSIPTTLISGMAIDYGMMNRHAERLQSAVDMAVLSGVSKPDDRQTIARNAFDAAIVNTGVAGSAAISFVETDTTLQAAGSILVKTNIMRLAGITEVRITRKAKAAAGSAGTPGISDRSCLLSGSNGGNTAADSLSILPAANVTLSGCGIHSNASMNCGGVATGAFYVTATGVATTCNGAAGGQAAILDVYSGLSSNIETRCGSAAGGVTWTAGDDVPDGANVISVTRTGYRELHICGDLTLAGSGAINGANPVEDIVVIIENGGVVLASNASIDAKRISLVLGGGSGNPVLTFPATAATAASLSISASTSQNNPWAGIALYQNPALSTNVNMHWHQYVSLSLDGIVYFPNAALTISGTVNSGPTGCAKLVSGGLFIDGSLTLSQSDTACSAAGVRQYHMAGGVTQHAYLSQ